MDDTSSILTSIKKMLGIMEDYTHFDSDIIMHINAVFMVLCELGVGPKEGFTVLDKNDSWDDFLPEGKLLNVVKSYVYLKVKLLFDPPVGSAAIESMNHIISEFEWRINVTVDPGEEVNGNVEIHV